MYMYMYMHIVYICLYVYGNMKLFAKYYYHEPCTKYGAITKAVFVLPCLYDWFHMYMRKGLGIFLENCEKPAATWEHVNVKSKIEVLPYGVCNMYTVHK